MAEEAKIVGNKINKPAEKPPWSVRNIELWMQGDTYGHGEDWK